MESTQVEFHMSKDLAIQWIEFLAIAAQSVGKLLRNQLLLWKGHIWLFWKKKKKIKYTAFILSSSSFIFVINERKVASNCMVCLELICYHVSRENSLLIYSLTVCWAWKLPTLTVQMYVPSSDTFSFRSVKDALPSATSRALSTLAPSLFTTALKIN